MLSVRNFLKEHGWNSVSLFFVIIVLVLAGYALWKDSTDKSAEDAARFVEMVREEEETRHNLRVQDTYGGETPQETLALYIEAVEEGDYELAAKYFVLEEQERELRSLQNSSQENIDNVVSLLKESLKSEGSYSNNPPGFTLRDRILVDLRLYPNKLWKIEYMDRVN